MKRVAPHAFGVAVICALACGGADQGILGPYDGSTSSPDALAPDDATTNDADTTDAATLDASAPDAITPKDAAPPYQDPGIACGKTYCDEDADLCCGTATSYYPQTVYAFACESLTDFVQCAAGLPVYCDDDKDCPQGQSCCGQIGYEDYSKIVCQAQACANSVFGQEDHMCDPKASDCDNNTTCKPSPNLAGYYACQ